MAEGSYNLSRSRSSHQTERDQRRKNDRRGCIFVHISKREKCFYQNQEQINRTTITIFSEVERFRSTKSESDSSSSDSNAERNGPSQGCKSDRKKRETERNGGERSSSEGNDPERRRRHKMRDVSNRESGSSSSRSKRLDRRRPDDRAGRRTSRPDRAAHADDQYTNRQSYSGATGREERGRTAGEIYASGGGSKYAGFGSAPFTPFAQAENQDDWTSVASALSTGNDSLTRSN